VELIADPLRVAFRTGAGLDLVGRGDTHSRRGFSEVRQRTSAIPGTVQR
jgi:hypothetical protein